MRRPVACSLACGAALIAWGQAARADGIDGAALLRLLGPRAQAAFAPPGAPGIGALIRLPPGVQARDVGLGEAAPGLGRLYGPPAKLLAFADAHPDLPMQVAPAVRALLDTAGQWVEATTATARGLDGTGALVGLADTGVDVTHEDFIEFVNGGPHTRIAWYLDLSAAPLGKHPDLEKQFGTPDSAGNIAFGAVWSADDIDAILPTAPLSALPQDEQGHGTMVASCAVGNGEQGRSVYRGMAPKAGLVVARVFSAGSETSTNDDLLRGVAFLFDRADFMKMPIVVNLSLGGDFGPHDGSLDWEQALASHVGPSHPGHALVVSAGNSGSIVDTPIHQQVHVDATSTTRVPIPTPGSSSGGVQVWIAMHAGTSLEVGLDGPDGNWIPPISPGQSGGKSTDGYKAGIYNGSSPANSPVPSGSNGAVAIWTGSWPAGTYTLTLSGSGTADLYVEGTGSLAGQGAVGFAWGVRESTITLPATESSLIAVGCTINKASWLPIHAQRDSHGKLLEPYLQVPDLDTAGGLPAADGGTRFAIPGEPCYFSSAGPTLTGIQKPEIMAPGGAIVGALSAEALPGTSASIFTTQNCPAGTYAPGGVQDCQQVDGTHAASFGTSFSSPVAAGAVAVLFQNDPTLTQDQVLAALQGGAHPLRGPAPYADQGGVGEVDVLGAVEAVDRLRNPATALPVLGFSWLTPGGDVYLADGSTPMQVIVELRAAGTGTGPPPPADGFSDGRLAAYALVDGSQWSGAVQSLVRRGPGVWVATVSLPGGLGGHSLTLGATFDGADIVTPRTIPIAVDSWAADYPASAKGGCAVGALKSDAPGCWILLVVAGIVARRRPR